MALFCLLSYSVAAYFDGIEKYNQKMENVKRPKKKLKKPKCFDSLDVHDGLGNFE